jgi:hypothetical protein
MSAGRRRMPYPEPESRWRRPLTPLEVGGLLVGLALLLACCGFFAVLGVVSPDQAPPVVYVTPEPTFR